MLVPEGIADSSGERVQLPVLPHRLDNAARLPVRLTHQLRHNTHKVPRTFPDNKAYKYWRKTLNSIESHFELATPNIVKWNTIHIYIYIYISHHSTSPLWAGAPPPAALQSRRVVWQRQPRAHWPSSGCCCYCSALGMRLPPPGSTT